MISDNNENNTSNRRGDYKRISQEIRDLILRHYDSRQTQRKIGRLLEIPESTIRSIIKNFNETGMNTPKQRGGTRNIKISEEIKNFLKEKLAENASLTLKQLSDLVEEKYEVILHSHQCTIH